MTRDQALNLVKLYDNSFPNKFLNQYLNYYEMEREEFESVLDKHVNKDLFKRVNGKWEPIFTII